MDNVMMNAARVAVKDCLAVKEGDKVLFVTDDDIGNANGLSELLDAMLQVLYEKNLDPTVICYKTRPGDGYDIPPVADVCCLDADVVISINTHSILYTSTFHKIFPTARRVLLLPPGVNIGSGDYLYRVMPQTKEELHEIADDTQKYGDMFKDGKDHKVHLTTRSGTDLMFSVGKLVGLIHGGVCTQADPGQLLPCGSLALGMDEGSAEGVLVADCCHALEDRFLEEPMTFRISEGYVQSVDDGYETKKFLAAADTHPAEYKDKFNIAEFGLGFNPKAELRGDVPEGELVRGAAHIAIGSNVNFGGHVNIPGWHIDFILPEATAEVDGKLILKDGNYLV